MFPIEEIISPPPITIVDIGAMLLQGAPDPLARLNQAGLATIIGFEPQPDECRKLNALAMPGRQYLPYAAGDGRRRTFFVTNPSSS